MPGSHSDGLPEPEPADNVAAGSQLDAILRAAASATGLYELAVRGELAAPADLVA